MSHPEPSNAGRLQGWRRYKHRLGVWISRHTEALIFVMAVIMLLTAIFAAIGWNKARNAQRRLTTVEATQRAEQLGKDIADVTSCFNRAKGRPQLLLILRGLAVKLDSDPATALNQLIRTYEHDTPSVADCVILAKKRDIDPKPYLQNPPSEAGNDNGK